jgi:hypothetical protein
MTRPIKLRGFPKNANLRSINDPIARAKLLQNNTKTMENNND